GDPHELTRDYIVLVEVRNKNVSTRGIDDSMKEAIVEIVRGTNESIVSRLDSVHTDMSKITDRIEALRLDSSVSVVTVNKPNTPFTPRNNYFTINSPVLALPLPNSNTASTSNGLKRPSKYPAWHRRGWVRERYEAKSIPTRPSISFIPSGTSHDANGYACSDSLLLTPLCCDDIHDVTPHVSALAGCDRLVSEHLVIENYVSFIRKKFCWGIIFPIGLKRYRDPKEEPIEKEPLIELKETG
ncbi:hypothetical protein Tco_0855113, partial [Tanacetum coccineum]